MSESPNQTVTVPIRQKDKDILSRLCEREHRPFNDQLTVVIAQYCKDAGLEEWCVE